MDIRQIDLNLLPVLDALLRHRSVSLAARELDLSQSATSAALARLRRVLDDPLFARTGRGLMPTPRAASLAEPVAELLDGIRSRVLQGAAFDEATARRSFRLMLTDVGAYVLWPRILRAVRERAPGVRLEMRGCAPADLAGALTDARIDLAIGAFPHLPASLYQRRLFDRRYVCLVGERHPLVGRRLSLHDLAAMPQIVVQMASGMQQKVDDALARHGLRRDHVLEMPSYLMVPPLLDGGDYAVVLPGQLADEYVRSGGYHVLDLPLRLPMSTIRLYWHARCHADAGNVWLRQLIARAWARRDAAGPV